ncbi:adhesion G-protein coupled receptor G6 isoform X3 [Alosa pseudoharengus]|uniref:adhesion G-protein coupled receptor G6 isoform X3 n=1 Tax=Alosa pseudoharengus TaxID=34774 RepID=UPI003F8A9CF6
MMLEITGRWSRWKVQLLFPVALQLIYLQQSVLSCQGDCNLEFTDPQGSFTSPCYPSDYPQSQSCKWTLRAPAGFIVQITFLDFELEEALGCIYDKVIVNTGTNDVKFCGLTANGLTLNSSGNVMEVSFNSDFSVQKKGFSINYKQVAVALRNQKVTLPRSSKDIVKLSSGISISPLNDFTICFEIARSAQRDIEIMFSVNSAKGYEVAFGKTLGGMALIIDNKECSIDSIINSADFTSAMKPLCLTWTKATGVVALQFDGNYRTYICNNLTKRTLKLEGLQLGAGGSGVQNNQDDVGSFDGFIYNFRIWSNVMAPSELSSLTCDSIGDLVDWDNNFWDIPSSYALTDSALSCICFPNCVHLTTPSSSGTSIPTLPSQTTSCSSPGLGCPAQTSPVSVTTSIPSISSSTIQTPTAHVTTISMTLKASTAQTSPVSVTTSIPSISSSTISPTSTFPPTVNQPASITNQNHEEVFYRVELVFPQQNEPDVTELTELLKSTSHYWIYPKHVKCDRDNKCQVILVHNMTMNSSAIMADIKDRLRSSTMDENGSVVVTLETVENCPEEKDLSDDRYKWLESRPMVTVHIPCLHFKDQYASRTCFIDSRDFKSKWNDSDAANCPSIKDIEVSEETAADVAVQLADISNNELSKEEVSTVVTKVKELVNVARINKTLAEAVVNIISNVMTSSSTAQAAASEIALRAVDNLVQKIEFEGPIFRTSSKNLAVGISAVNASEFNGTTFSAIIPPNTTEPEIKFLAESENPLAVVTLPATLLLNLTNANIEAISRINFVFFSKTGLFQDDIRNGLSLNSYVVASSVGNFSIRNLKDPVRIEIAHLLHKPDPKRSCVFWDFTIKNGIGGWNSEGCLVSPDSSDNRTVCLCNHLTHFGILMDISGTAAQIDYQNTRVLTFITYIGCGVSAIFSAATLLTYITFEKLRRDHPAKILMNLSTSLLFLNMVFLLDGWLASFGMEGLCIAVAVFMHFFLLTSFTWMGLESIHMYMALVKVFNTYIRRYILKFCLVGWGLPAAIVCIVVAVDKHSYGLNYYGKGDIGQESSKFCWIRSNTVFYVTCVGYFSIIFLMNVAMFIVVMIQICGRNGKRSNRTLREEILRNLRSVVSLTFLLGMTWGFAFFAWGPVNLAFMYLFSIFNSLQGLFIFVFHCALKENVQKQWRRYLCCGQLRLADNSDWSKTATNNTKKVSSDNLGKSLSSSSFSSSTANWTSKAKASLNPFANYNNSSDKISSSPINFKCCPSDGEASIIPVHHVIDKMKGYCSVRSEHFYKNFIMSDNFNHNTKF